MTAESGSERGVVIACRAPVTVGPDELPGDARRLAANPPDGWTCRATVAARYLDDDAERFTISTAVRLAHRDGHRAVAWWTNGKPDAGAFRPAGWPWWQPCGVSDVARAVRAAVPTKRRRGQSAPADPFAVEPDAETEPEVAP